MPDTPFERLMRQVCVEFGFCGAVVDGQPRHVTDFIPAFGCVTSDQFTAWVLLADGVAPVSGAVSYAELKTAIRRAFVEHMGGDVVDADMLRYSADR